MSLDLNVDSRPGPVCNLIDDLTITGVDHPKHTLLIRTRNNNIALGLQIDRDFMFRVLRSQLSVVGNPFTYQSPDFPDQALAIALSPIVLTHYLNKKEHRLLICCPCKSYIDVILTLLP